MNWEEAMAKFDKAKTARHLVSLTVTQSFPEKAEIFHLTISGWFPTQAECVNIEAAFGIRLFRHMENRNGVTHISGGRILEPIPQGL